MAKAEISWRRRDDAGENVHVYAQHVGKRWIFRARHRRYDQWQTLEHPPLEDWLSLLDAIRRRAARRLVRPEEIQHVTRSIRERYPEATV